MELEQKPLDLVFSAIFSPRLFHIPCNIFNFIEKIKFQRDSSLRFPSHYIIEK